MIFLPRRVNSFDSPPNSAHASYKSTGKNFCAECCSRLSNRVGSRWVTTVSFLLPAVATQLVDELWIEENFSGSYGIFLGGLVVY